MRRGRADEGSALREARPLYAARHSLAFPLDVRSDAHEHPAA
jgi:hypothetical protein